MSQREVMRTDGPIDRLTMEGLVIVRGWDDNLASQLVENSVEPEILKRTPRDAAERFRDVESANEWYASDPKRVIYALARSAELAGVIWFSNKATEGLSADYTFAIRMYDMVRGKGFAEGFASRATKDFESHSDHKGGIWLETDDDNLSAIHLYKKLGYHTVRKSDSRIKMVRERGFEPPHPEGH